MAYETTNPPKLLVQSIGGQGPSIWQYDDDDATTDVDAAGYFTNGVALGMKVGDIVTHEDLSAGATYNYRVESLTATAANLGDGTVVGSTTDSD